MDGRNITCEIMVSFAWFFTDSPKTLPILNDTAVKIASEPKYNGRFVGGVASKAIGATMYIIAHIINKWINADKNIETRPRYNGTPLALYTFFISLPYISTREGGKPISAPVDTPSTVIDCISVYLASGFMDVNIPPITAKNKRGTT